MDYIIVNINIVIDFIRDKFERRTLHELNNAITYLEDSHNTVDVIRKNELIKERNLINNNKTLPLPSPSIDLEAGYGFK